jgi:single-strand DNA-binding protein
MNKIILRGRITRDPEVRYGGANNTAVARFSIAVDRRFKREGDPTADFFNITAFGRLGEFAEKYLKKGTKILLDGELRNDNYTNKDGQKVYGMQIIANNIEFAESKSSQGNMDSMPAAAAPQEQATTGDAGDGFMSIADGIVDELPFG